MIDKLTPEQEARIQDYVVEFRALGTQTMQCDRPKAEDAVRRAYAYMKYEEPQFIWLSNPQQGARLAADLVALEGDEPAQWALVEKVRAKGIKALGWKDTEANKKRASEQIGYASYGSFEAYWVSFYAYIGEVLNVGEKDLVQIVRDLVTHCGVYFTFDKLVIMTERPLSISFNQERQLHNQDGPALSYKDGFNVYAMNNIKMPEYYCVTAKEDIDVKRIMKEKNVDIRREAMRKVGFERVMTELEAKRIHTTGEYDLVELDFGDDIKARYLKMLNPSIGQIHVEGVADECQTVEDALMFRNREILQAIGAKGWQAPTVLT